MLVSVDLREIFFFFHLCSIFGLIYYTLIIPSKAFTQDFTTAVAITVSGTQLPSEQWGFFWTWRFVFVSFIAICLPTCLPTNDLRPDGYCDFLNFAPFQSCTLVC